MHLLALCSRDCSPGCWAGRGVFLLVAAVLLLSRGGCRGNVLIVGLFGAQSSEWSWALWQPRGTAQKTRLGICTWLLLGPTGGDGVVWKI